MTATSHRLGSFATCRSIALLPPTRILAAGLAALCCLWVPPRGVEAAEPAPLALGSRRELFVDRILVDHLVRGATLRLHAPTPCEQVLTFDLPWEGVYSGYITVFADDDRL